MSIKRFYPIKDTTIYSSSLAECNFGLDEILEVGRCSKGDNFEDAPARILMKFNTEDIQSELDTIPAGSSFRLVLHLSLADASNLPETYVIKGNGITEEWDEGTGKMSDFVFAKGASWNFKNLLDSGSAWAIAGGDYNTESSTAFSSPVYYRASNKDLNLDLSNCYTSEAFSEGLVLALGDESLTITQRTSLLFFSSDTHTVYKPYLELCWDDSVYSSSLTPISDIYYTQISNLKKEYSVGDRIKLSFTVYPQYPARVFSTSSIYQNNYILPADSRWGIKDEYTNEMVVNFSDYTKISANNSGSFCYLNTELLEPERYYRLLLQVALDGTTVVLDGHSIFKVIRSGRN